MTASLLINEKSLSRTLATLGEFPRAVQNKVVRIAVNAGGGVIKKSEESLAAPLSVVLSKSVRVKVKVPKASFNVKHHGKPAYAIIGPSRSIVGLSTNKSGKVKELTEKQVAKGAPKGGTIKRGKPSRYAHLIEGGTKAHRIKPKPGGRLLTDGYYSFGGAVNHPGTRARSFVGAAIQQSGQQALDKMNSKLAEGINQQAAQFAAQVK